ncbi:PAS domain-containing protein, partial [Acinetobacter baumannii]
MPSRQDIDPAEIVPLLPFVALVDVIPDVPVDRRYRVRLFGTQLVEYHQKDWTGKQIADVTSAEAAQRIIQAGEF